MKESDVFIVKLTFCKNGDNPAFAIEGNLYRYFAFEDGDTDEYVFRPLNMDNENANYDRGYLRFAEFSDYTVFEFVFHEVADSDSNVTYTREMTEYVGEPCRVEIISRSSMDGNTRFRADDQNYSSKCPKCLRCPRAGAPRSGTATSAA